MNLAMTTTQKIFGTIMVLFLFSTIVYLVKKGKLREEYSWMWLLTGLVLFVIVIRYDFLLFISRLIGAKDPTNTLFIFGIVFLLFLCMHFAIKISLLTHEVKNLAQKISILEAEQNQGIIR